MPATLDELPMVAARPNPRFSPAERLMLADLLQGWKRSDDVCDVSGINDVIRRCVVEAFNKKHRRGQKLQVDPMPGGDARYGRPADNDLARPPFWKRQLDQVKAVLGMAA